MLILTIFSVVGYLKFHSFSFMFVYSGVWSAVSTESVCLVLPAYLHVVICSCLSCYWANEWM